MCALALPIASFDFSIDVVSVSAKPRSLVTEHVALDYDQTQAAEKMRAANLPEGYVNALSTGLWPSCDVLPPTEVGATGRPLSGHILTWERGQPLIERAA